MFISQELSVADAVFDTVRANGGPTLLGQRLGIRPAVLANKANPRQTGNHLSLNESLRVMLVTGDHRILRALASALGYVLVPIDCPPPSDIELLTLYAKWQDKSGQVHHAIARAFQDRRVTKGAHCEVERRFFDATADGLTYIQRMGGLVQ